MTTRRRLAGRAKAGKAANGTPILVLAKTDFADHGRVEGIDSVRVALTNDAFEAELEALAEAA